MPIRAFPAWVEQVLVRRSSVECDVRLEFSDHVGEGAEGMGNAIATLLQEMHDAVAEVDVPDLEPGVSRSCGVRGRAIRSRAARSRRWY